MLPNEGIAWIARERDVPVAFADREWTEFVFRSLYGSYAKGFYDVATSL